MFKNSDKLFITGWLFILLGIFLALVPSPGIVKDHPDFHSIDTKAKPIYYKYIALAKRNHLVFHHTATIGFQPLHYGNAIGVCYYFANREIQVDTGYWDNHSDTQKEILLFHELTHCYCGREHDWAKDKKYAETYTEKKIEFFKVILLGTKKPGYWLDGCPMSIMHPSIISDECYETHHIRYLKEMFERCEAY